MYKQIQAFVLVLTFFGSCRPMTVMLPRALPQSAPQNNPYNSHNISDYQPDHPDWQYLNAKQWWELDNTQPSHARYHALLSMAVYGDYETTCPNTFTQGFTVLEKFGQDGAQLGVDTRQAGFVAQVPEMDKILIVFEGYSSKIDSMDWTPVSIEDLVSDCSGCQVAKGIKDLYLSAKTETNDWAIARKAVMDTKLKFSVTGHGTGGAVAALAGLDLGSRNWVHYSHNQGMPRAFNEAAVIKYDNLFQVLAGQSLVAKNDYMVQHIPFGPFVHVATKVMVNGPFQSWLTNCYGNNENVTCTGDGSNQTAHDYYFTEKGKCGSVEKGW